MSNFIGTFGENPVLFFEEFVFLRLFIFHVWLCIVIFGLLSNTMNIVVFGKIGFRDNVTVTLLFLYISDLLNLILRCPIVVAWFMDQNYPFHDWPFHPKILDFGIYWWAYIFYGYSSFISVFLALVSPRLDGFPAQLGGESRDQLNLQIHSVCGQFQLNLQS